jgi:coenzyme PQQ precursor peptide PqqA
MPAQRRRRHLHYIRGGPSFNLGVNVAPNYLQVTWETEMAWKAPKIVEVPVGMEINMYACAARK